MNIFSSILLIIFPVIFIAACFMIIFVLDKQRAKGLSDEMLENWHNDPANWRMGVFYHNRKDPRLLPPKRIKAMGWTVNTANPVSVGLLIGIVLIVILTVVLQIVIS